MSEASTPRVAARDPRLIEQYRARGWWSGERLENRYAGLTEADPHRCAVVDDRGACLTRRELWTVAAAFAQELREAGVLAGEVVLIYLPNVVAWQVAFLATLQVGAVPATLPMTTDAEGLSHTYGLTCARAIVAPRRFRGRPAGMWAREAAAASGQQASLVVVEDDGTRTWEHWDREPVAPGLPTDVNHLMFTSSTTGMPKAVMHTSDTLGSANQAFVERFSLTEDSTIFMPSPLGHSVGAWHGGRLSLYTGATLVLQDEWDPARGLELVDQHRCQFTVAATPFLKDLMDAEWHGSRPKLATLRAFVCGGAPVPPSLLTEAAAQTPETFVTVLWGMTEGTGTTCIPGSTTEQLTETVGVPVPGLELSILEPDPDGIGELAMRGPQVFVGYLGQEELFASLITPEGFFRTGDRARLDQDGYVRLSGRFKDLIIRGGVNISPSPIEDAVAAHPAVRRVAVVGRQDERLGERICAVIVSQGTPPTLEDLRTWLTEHGVHPRKLPESLVTVEEMPVTAAGKIRKPELRKLLEEA